MEETRCCTGATASRVVVAINESRGASSIVINKQRLQTAESRAFDRRRRLRDDKQLRTRAVAFSSKARTSSSMRINGPRAKSNEHVARRSTHIGMRDVSPSQMTRLEN